MREKLTEAIRVVEAAEKIALAGSYEHEQYVKAALMNAWPTIRAYAEYEGLSPVAAKRKR